jgi:hypothetical protein
VLEELVEVRGQVGALRGDGSTLPSRAVTASRGTPEASAIAGREN